jgi:Ran GTPase-activating protein (RanGAP) involved in mRNA processing and transport
VFIGATVKLPRIGRNIKALTNNKGIADFTFAEGIVINRGRIRRKNTKVELLTKTIRIVIVFRYTEGATLPIASDPIYNNGVVFILKPQ